MQISAKNYRELRKEIMGQLSPDLFKRDWTVGLLAFIAFVAYWTIFMLALRSDWMLLPAVFLLGYLGEFLSIANHDILHGSVFRSKKLSLLFCIPSSLINLISPSFWRYWHNFHHDSVDRWTTTHRPYEMGYESEGYPTLNKFLGPFELFIYKTFHMTRTQLKFVTSFEKLSFKHAQLRTICRFEVLLMMGFKVLLFVILPFKYWLFLELFPLLLQNFISSLFLVTQHSDKLESHATVRTFSVALPKVLEKLSLNLGYHIEHHLFPNLPSKNLPKVQTFLIEKTKEFPQTRLQMDKALTLIYKANP